ncbi:hypothetical protein [Planctomicrobium sp. SH527]|uniref:hypothetical protein n=1 Tax=Planctomicrobium sp. SH527 TaxID=3448123 RepID=UPI003F5C5F3B
MTTTPFRAAFWAMSLACLMTAVLVFPNPNKIRAALRAQRTAPPLLPYERSLLARAELELEEVEEEIDEEEVAPQIAEVQPKPAPAPKEVTPQPEKMVAATPVETPKPAPEPTPAPAAEPAPAVAQSVPVPVQVALANTTAPFGLMAPVQPQAEAPQPAQPATVPEAPTTVLPFPAPQADTPLIAGPISSSQSAAMTLPEPWTLPIAEKRVDAPINIMVPDPLHQATPSQPVAEPKWASVQAPSTLEPNPFEPTPFRRSPSQMTVEPSVAVTTKPHLTSEVIQGGLPGKFTFRFNNAPLHEVLRMIGEQGGSQVVVDASIQGNFTGELSDIDPALALGMVVKANRFTVNRRGNFLLIGVRSER